MLQPVQTIWKRLRTLIRESKGEIVGGVVAGLILLATPSLLDLLLGATVQVPAYVYPVALAVGVIGVGAVRVVRWGRAVTSRVTVLEDHAAEHRDALDIHRRAVSVEDAIRVAESRGWTVMLEPGGTSYKMTKKGPDGRELSMGMGIEFKDGEERRPEFLEGLFASSILSTVRRRSLESNLFKGKNGRDPKSSQEREDPEF
jgi:hypothetical protein